jgi:uncharacterized surface protein with fasciclin (FAS1) repeats
MSLSTILKTTALAAIATVSLGGAFAQAKPSPITDKAGHARHERTIVAVAAGDSRFSTLVAAVQAAGLVNTLNGSGPFTVFAPVNDAFDALPQGAVERLLQPRQRDRLVQILTYHVVAGRISAADLATAVRVGNGRATLTTVEGGGLVVTAAGRGRLRLTDAAGDHFDIVVADVAASNGIIHAIDGVLMPH